MKEKTLKKIKKLLEKEGVEEGKIDSIVAEIEATEEGADENDNENQDEENVENVDSNEVPPTPNPEGDVPPEVDGEGEVPPSADPIPDQPALVGDNVPPIVPAEVEGEVPPTVPAEEVPPAIPPTLDPQIQDLINKLDESEKARAALEARVNSLEDALKQAGVIENNGTTSVGDERPNLPQSEENQAQDLLDGVLKRLNGK